MAMFFDPFREFDRVANGMLGVGSLNGMPVDLYRQGDHYILDADLPGVDPNSVDVSVENQWLTIRAQRTAAQPDGAQWLAHERPSVSFMRQFSIGDAIDADNVSASYRDGVLSVVIPVAESAKTRKIQVSTSAGAPALDARQSKSTDAAQASEAAGAQPVAEATPVAQTMGA